MDQTELQSTKAISAMDSSEITDLAEQFILQYYEVMRKCPNELHRFYLDESTLIFESQPTFGQAGIHNLFLRLNLKETCVHIIKVDAIKSHRNSLLMQIIGELNCSGGPYRRFLRGLTLVEKNLGDFFILTDIIRFQDRVYVAEAGQQTAGKTPLFVYDHLVSANQGENLTKEGQASHIPQDRASEDRNKAPESELPRGTEVEYLGLSSTVDDAQRNLTENPTQEFGAQQKNQTNCNQQIMTEKASGPTVMTWAQLAAKRAAAPILVAPKLQKATKPAIIGHRVTSELRKQPERALNNSQGTRKQGPRMKRRNGENNDIGKHTPRSKNN